MGVGNMANCGCCEESGQVIPGDANCDQGVALIVGVGAIEGKVGAVGSNEFCCAHIPVYGLDKEGGVDGTKYGAGCC